MLGKENIEKQVADNQSKREGTLLSSNQQILSNLQILKDFEIKEAIGGGDCFFDAVAQGLRQLKPGKVFTVKSLREICKNLALSDQQLKEQVIKDAKSFHDPTVVLPDPNISEDELWNVYLASIEYTAEDIKGMETQNLNLYRSLTSLEYGSTLQVPIWGRPNIEGRMICSKYNVKLHIIENLPNSGYSHQLVDGLASRSVGCIDYSEENTIHIINKGNSHFEPILRISHCYDTMISEENPDSKFVHFQQNSQNDVTDDQMDYQADVDVLPTESATVNYEPIEEFQRRQSYRSQSSSTKSSSASSDDAWYSAYESIANTASDKVMKKAAFFVKIFVKKIEEKLSEYNKEARPGSKTRKSGKILSKIDSIVKSAVPPGIRLIPDTGNGILAHCSAAYHREKAKKTSMLLKDQTRESLVKDGLEIFQSFEEQMTRVVDITWGRGIEKLAMDAASRVMNYILANSKRKEFPVSHITEGVVSEKKYLLTTHSGYRIKDKQSGKTLKTSALYRNVGIKKNRGWYY